MERAIHIEKLPEGVYLATSDDLQALRAEPLPRRWKSLAIVRDLARILIEAQSDVELPPLADRFDYPL